MKNGAGYVATILLSITACSGHAPRVTQTSFPPTAEILVTSSPNTSVLIFSSSPARFALRGNPLALRSDTIRTTTPAMVNAYLDQGDITIVSETNVPIAVEATLANAAARHVTATGRGAVLQSGGVGINTR